MTTRFDSFLYKHSTNNVYTDSTPTPLCRKHLHREDVVLNFKDYSGDLVEMADSDDIELMKSEGIPPRKKSGANHAHWAVYVTQRNDHTPYRRHSQQTS